MKKAAPFIILFLFSSIILIAQENTNKLGNNFKKDVPNKSIDTKSSSLDLNNTNSVATYDFTTGPNQYYGGTAAAVEVENGVWAMMAGDANGDGTINAVDYNDFWFIQNGTVYDYSKTGDFNLDGTINAVDYNDFWFPNNGKATQVPN